MPLHTPIEPFGAWQEGAMKNVADHFRPTYTVDGLGLPGFAGYVEVVRGQKYQHLPTRNFSEPSDIGRIIQPSSISTEFGYWPAGVDLKDGDLIRDVTPGGLINGIVYCFLGAATAFDAIPVAEASYANVELRQEPKAPEDLPA